MPKFHECFIFISIMFSMNFLEFSSPSVEKEHLLREKVILAQKANGGL